MVTRDAPSYDIDSEIINSAAHPTRTSGQMRAVAAFTLVEILSAVAIVVFLGAAATLSFLQLNRTAAASRCYIGAEAVAQTQIDRILSQPFPQGGPSPVELTVGTTTQNGITIYRDPVSGSQPVTGTLSTTITDLSRVIIANTPSSPLYRADVVVSYTYRGKTYNVTASTLRGAD
jgi:type II secretory pathway pseudopilin PulG